MADLLTELAKAQGAKLAVVDDRPDGTIVRWTFAQLEENANRLARVFRSAGLEPREKMVWCGQNSPWVVAAIHAARKIGAVAVPLNYRLSGEEAAYVVDDSDAALVFADAEYVPLFERIRDRVPNVREVLIFDGSPGENQLDALALAEKQSGGEFSLGTEAGGAGTMIYTSGTTGHPKGVVREGGGVGDPAQAAKLLELFGVRGDDIYITTGPLYHSGPGGFLAIAQALGNSVVLQRRFDPEDWLRLVDKYKVSSTFSAPTPVRRICQLDDDQFAKYDVSSMRLMIANAAPWSFALKREYLARFPARSLFEVYGSTELGVDTVLEPADQLRKPGSCGRPAPGVEIVLVDENNEVVTEPHTPGEVFIRSAGVFTTYYKAHEKFLEEQRGDMQTVGDVAYFDEEGFYYICDRKKDMIISGGVNIYPAEIEAALEQHPDLMDVAVFGIPDEEWGESVHAVVVVRSGVEVSAEAIRAFAREHLAGYKVPRSVSFMDEIPRTGSGKILKRVLREPYWKDHERRV